jgi:hypothetical protein
VTDENGDLFADSHNMLNRWKNCFSQLLNVYGVIDVKQIQVHMAELLVPDLNSFGVEFAVAKFKGINHQLVINFGRFDLRRS